MRFSGFKWPDFGLGKYGVIVISIALFVLLDTGVLLLNFYTSYQISEDAHAIQVVSRQTTLSQQILQALHQVKEDLDMEKSNYDLSVDLLAKAYRSFDEAIESMTYGTQMIGQGLNQDELFTNPTYQQATSGLLAETQLIWQEYRKFIDPVANSFYEIEINETMSKEDLANLTQKAINYGRENNVVFLGLLQQISHTTEQIAHDKAQRLRYIQMTGIALALTNFFIILFHFIRKLNTSDRKLEMARRETDEILDNVNEGLFLIDEHYQIGMQSSASLSRLLHNDDLKGNNLIDIMRPLLSEKNLEIMRDYLDILMQDHVRHHLVRDLNPLKEIEVIIDNNDGSLSTQYLTFDFSRVNGDNGKFLHLLATVNDVTDRILLRRELEQTEQKNNREIEVLLSILHLESSLVSSFLQQSTKDLETINRILKHPANSQSSLTEKINEISRLAHRVKGDCSALGLSTYQTYMHEFEDKLSTLSKRPVIEGADFVEVTVTLKQLIREWELLELIFDRLQQIGTKNIPIDESDTHASHQPVDTVNSPEAASDEGDWTSMLNTLATESAAYFDKQVNLNLEQFDISLIPRGIMPDIKTFLIQAVRNAIAHGIEHPDERVSNDKHETGKIEIYSRQQKSQVLVGIRDDGAGLDLHAMRLTALDNNIWDAEKAQKATKQDYLDLIFTSGISTENEINPFSGRGIGLDLIKSAINAMGGAIDVGSKAGKYTEFRISIPAEMPLQTNVA